MVNQSKILRGMLVAVILAAHNPEIWAQEAATTNQGAAVQLSAEDVPKGTAITSRRDTSTSIPPVQTTVTRDASKSDVAINWENVTLKDCIEVLSRDLGMEFIISPSVNVTQEVSIRAGDVTSWDRENKLELFDAVLETAGVQRTLRGRVWVFAPSDIRPVVKAFEENELTDGKPIIGVIKLNSINAAQAQQFLNTVGGKPQRVFGMNGSSTLIVLGTKAYLKQMEELVKLVDFPPSVLSHYILKEADAEDVARELTNIFYRRSGGDGQPVRFIAVARLNTVVAHNLPPSLVPEIDKWIKLLDRSDDLNERVTKVYRMQVIEAETIGKTLGKLYSDLYKQAQQRERELGKTASKAKTQQAKAPVSKTNAKTTSKKKVAATAAKPVAASKAANGSAPAASRPMDEEVIILSDKDTNTLIINAPADMHKDIERTIKELDKSRRQVLIETVIVEVTLDEGLDLGVEWAIMGDGNPAHSGAQLSGLGIGALATNAISAASDGLSYLMNANNEAMALIHAAQDDNRLQVLSSPNVLTRDGMEAEVSFGKEVPIRQSSLTDGGNQNFSFDYRDAKISLIVTPHIDDNDMVTLNIEQVVRRVEESQLASDLDAPVFRTREIRSNLQVDSGQTIILGGLIERSDVEARIGIPFLKNIPYLGWLFGRTVTRKEGAEILMILTPHVVDSRSETDLLTRDFRRKIIGSMNEKNIRDLYDLEDGDYVPTRLTLPEPAITGEQE